MLPISRRFPRVPYPPTNMHPHREVRQHTYYLIRRPDNAEPASMVLGLRSAATVLEIVRAKLGPDLVSLMSWLASRCIHFQTFLRAPPKILAPLPPPLFSGLGYRPPGYKPDTLDYRAYVSTCLLYSASSLPNPAWRTAHPRRPPGNHLKQVRAACWANLKPSLPLPERFAHHVCHKLLPGVHHTSPLDSRLAKNE